MRTSPLMRISAGMRPIGLVPGNREGASRWTAVSFVDAALASYSGRASAATIAGISVPCSQLLG
jgi:hypothetical protein